MRGLPLLSAVAVEAQLIFLTEALVVEHHVNGVAIVFAHAIREASGHYRLRVVRGVDAHDVEQVGRAHRPAELFFHHFIDLTEVGAVAQQQAEAGEIREQHAVDEEARAVVHHDRRFAHAAGVGHHFGDGVIAGLFAADDFNQRHAVYRVKEVHAAEVLRALQRFCQ